jgi:hypothetical protein
MDIHLTNHDFKIKGGKTWHLTQQFYDELMDTYPLVDVEGEMRASKLWCKVNKSNRKTARGMSRFLLGWCGRAEQTGIVTTTPEKSREEVVQDRIVRDNIAKYQSVIKEWPVGKLKANSGFMSASQYPDFAAWALEQRPDLRGAKAEIVAPVVAEAVIKPVPVTIEPVPVVQDLPPPLGRRGKIEKRAREIFAHRDKLLKNVEN